jgi:hypothetical protein
LPTELYWQRPISVHLLLLIHTHDVISPWSTTHLLHSTVHLLRAVFTLLLLLQLHQLLLDDVLVDVVV